MIRKEIKESVLARIDSMIYDKSNAKRRASSIEEETRPSMVCNLPSHLLLSKEEKEEMVERARQRAEEKRKKREENLRIRREEEAKNQLRIRRERSLRLSKSRAPKVKSGTREAVAAPTIPVVASDLFLLQDESDAVESSGMAASRSRDPKRFPTTKRERLDAHWERAELESTCKKKAAVCHRRRRASRREAADDGAERTVPVALAPAVVTIGLGEM